MQFIQQSETASHLPLVWNLDGSCVYFGMKLTAEQVNDVRKMFTGSTILEQLGMARYAGFI